MQRIVLYLILLSTFFLFRVQSAEKPYPEDPEEIFAEMFAEISQVKNRYTILNKNVNNRISLISEELRKDISLESKVNLLIEKDALREELKKLNEEEYGEVSKIRYLKGLQVLKILYEKILSLDHHFSSVYTLSEINKISNPNTYPEFQKVRDLVSEKKNRKFSLDLGNLISENPILSATQTFVNMLSFSGSSKASKEELKNLECIMDFTVSMQGDLNTIYFETTFLSSGNEALKKDIETLFADYTHPIGYEKDLQECRSRDDWDAVKNNLNNYLRQMAAAKDREQFKKHVNIEFPIDRLLRFIESYNNFIDQGEQFYRKFKIILNSYENAESCESQLPIEYTKLKGDIDKAIEKFNVAYKPVEVNGSKMKEILYGLNDYE